MSSCSCSCFSLQDAFHQRIGRVVHQSNIWMTNRPTTQRPHHQRDGAGQIEIIAWKPIWMTIPKTARACGELIDVDSNPPEGVSQASIPSPGSHVLTTFAAAIVKANHMTDSIIVLWYNVKDNLGSCFNLQMVFKSYSHIFFSFLRFHYPAQCLYWPSHTWLRLEPWMFCFLISYCNTADFWSFCSDCDDLPFFPPLNDSEYSRPLFPAQ